MTTLTNTASPTYIAKKIEEQRFEFVLYINNHIICQRYFNIRDFNEDFVKDGFEMKELMDNITGINNGTWGDLGIIPKHLKTKAVDYLWNNYNPYYIQPEEGVKNIFEKFSIIFVKLTLAQNIKLTFYF